MFDAMQQPAIDRAIYILGSQNALAKAVGVTQSLVSQWSKGDTAIHPRHFPLIEKATKGLVKMADLLDDQIARDRKLRSA